MSKKPSRRGHFPRKGTRKIWQGKQRAAERKFQRNYSRLLLNMPAKGERNE